MTATGTPKSTGDMMSDILGHVGNLVRNEADLARTEVAESLAKARASLVAMALALVLAVTGLNLIAASLVALVVWAGVPPHWATPAVGIAVLFVALAVYAFAKSAFHKIGFVPTRAARNVQRDATVVKDAFNGK